MNIVINAILFHKKPRGVGNYFNTLLRELLNLDKENQYYVIYGPWMEEYDFLKYKASNLHLIPYDIPRNKILRNLYLLLRFPFKIKKYHPDILHNIDTTPVIFKTCKIVSTIHDVAEFVQREKYSRFQGFCRRKYVKIQAKKSDRIITVSNFSKNSICQILKIKPNKIDVVYNAYEPKKVQGNNDRSIKYILTVGELEKSKNFGIIIEALNKLDISDLRLKIVGKEGNDYENIMNLYNHSPKKSQIDILGYVSKEELDRLYQNATIFVFPSLFEGFGIPIIEAMGNEIPVICSNSSCLPEIGGDACLYFNPNDSNELKENILRLYSNEDLAKDLVEKGKQQLKKFTTLENAKATLEVYQKLANKN